MHQSDTYFAILPPDELGAELLRRQEAYQDEIMRNGRLELWRKSHRMYFSLDAQGRHEAVEIQAGGEQGELSLLKANHYRNLLSHLVTLVTQQRPAWECRATNKDYRSQVQTILGKNILEYYMREHRLAAFTRKAAERAIVYSEVYAELDWDDDLGEEVRPDIDEETGEPNGNVLRAGEFVFNLYDPINVCRSTRQESNQSQKWYILKKWVNKYDLAAKHGQYRDEILGSSNYEQDDKFYYYSYPAAEPEDNSDLIPVFVFYHERTPACPTGRIARFLSDGTIYSSTTLDAAKLKNMPVFQMMPSDQHGMSFGYTVGFDLLCVQEAIDILYSTILSNQATFGVQNIWLKPGASISTIELAGGLNVIESAEEPKPLNLTNTPPEIFNFLKGLETLGEMLSGINSVARGQPEASLKSGAALALVASQAVQFSNGLQAAWIQFLEDMGTGILSILKTKAQTPRLAVIAGKDNRHHVQEFVGDDLMAINRVVVDVGNAMAQTVAGRIQMADNLLERGAIKRPEEYIQVIETGRVDVVIDDERSEMLLIDSENEQLRQGAPTPVTAIDKHLEHIKGHRQVLADPEDRLNPQVVQATLMHIQEHINQLRTVDPALLNALGQAAIQTPPPGAPPMQGVGQNAPQPNAKPEQQGVSAPTPPGEQVQAPPGTPPEVAANLPTMPKPPNA